MGEAVEDGLGLCESVERTSCWRCAHGKAKVEAADGSSGRRKLLSLVYLFFRGGEVNGLEVEEGLTAMATLSWAGRRVWRRERLTAWRKQISEVQRWKQGRGPAGTVTC